MADGKLFPPPANIQQNAHCSSMEQYKEMYKRSTEDPAGFWSEIAKEFYWKTPPKSEGFLEYNFDVGKGPISIKWMEGAVTNVCYNMLDRHIDAGHGDVVAFYW